MDKLTFHLFDVVVAAGILQAIIMAIVLGAYRVTSQAKKLFIFILLTLAVLSFKILLHTIGLWNLPAFRYFPLAVDTLLSPLLYLYALSITGNPVNKNKIALYFIPTLVFVLYALVVYVCALSQPSLSQKDELANQLLFNQVKTAEDVIALVSAVIYWLLSFRRIIAYRKWLYNSQSNTKFHEYTWLRNLLVITGILVLALFFVIMLEDLFAGQKHSFIVLQGFYIYLVAITYYLSFKGYTIYGSAQYGEAVPAAVIVKNNNELAATRLTRDMAEEYEIIKGRIHTSMVTDRLYLHAELSLKDLAKHLGYPTATISAVINQCLQLNFRTLVNQYRVEEVKTRLKDPPPHLSLLGIALDCGFNSEASFYRIFRQETGLSPNDYLRMHKS
jgi:AraC-like DNA-binding protein